jgi:hypothetical protein
MKNPEQAGEKEISGKAVILFMAAFAMLMTALMWIYWKWNLAPFLPLQQAIVAVDHLKESRPVVEGGRLKGQQNAPKTLRVTMKVDYNPEEETDRVDALETEILELAKVNLPQFDEYDQFELNVYWPKQETELKPITVQRVRDLR